MKGEEGFLRAPTGGLPFACCPAALWSPVPPSQFLLSQSFYFLILLIVSLSLNFSGCGWFQLYLPVSLNTLFQPLSGLLPASFTKDFFIPGSGREFDSPAYLFLLLATLTIDYL